jgi:hypothetical protein
MTACLFLTLCSDQCWDRHCSRNSNFMQPVRDLHAMPTVHARARSGADGSIAAAPSHSASALSGCAGLNNSNSSGGHVPQIDRCRLRGRTASSGVTWRGAVTDSRRHVAALRTGRARLGIYLPIVRTVRQFARMVLHHVP